MHTHTHTHTLLSDFVEVNINGSELWSKVENGIYIRVHISLSTYIHTNKYTYTHDLQIS